MALISNGTTIASGGSLSVAPTNSQILTGVASAGGGVVGSYAFLFNESAGEGNINDNVSGSSYRYSSSNGFKQSTPSGTWKVMGRHGNTNYPNNDRTTVLLRVS